MSGNAGHKQDQTLNRVVSATAFMDFDLDCYGTGFREAC
jgi:hypothetical protein